MLSRPNEFKFLAVAMLAIALSFPLQVFFLFEETQLGFVTSGMGLTPLNWAVMSTAFLSACFAFQASRFVLLTLFLFLTSVAWNNWLVAEIELNYSGLTAWAAVAFAVFIPLVLARESARKVLLNPQLRWWRTPTRKKVHVQALVYPVMGGEVFSQTIDISEGGAFVEMPLGNPKAAYADPQTRAVAVGNHCAVRLRLDQLNVVNCSARIVRKTKAAGEYPDGFALQFVNLNTDQRKQIRNFMAQEPQMAA